MYSYSIMEAQFEAEKNRKAFIYTVIICVILLLLAIFIRWTIQQPPIPIVQDLIEINLGNNSEGYGQVQPLIKSEMNNSAEPVQQQQKASASHDEPARDIQTDENEDKDAAPVVKPLKPNPDANNITKQPITKRVKNNNPAPVLQPEPKPKKPLATYNGTGNGKGNGATTNNDVYNQGNNPNGRGDVGDPKGNADSYGNTPGGKIGGPRVIRGDRNIIRYYSFTDELGRATINAIIKVSPEGKGSFAGFDKGSSTTSQAYATAIQQHLSQIEFSKSDHESVVTVQFNFNVK
jgi:hypothetical protein